MPEDTKEISVSVGLDPKEINEYLAKKVSESVIGATIIDYFKGKFERDWEMKNHVEATVKKIVRDEISIIICRDYMDEIKKRVVEGISQDVVDALISKALEKMTRDY